MIDWEKPTPAAAWIAIDIYLGLAYDGTPSAAVRSRLDVMRAATEGAFYQCAALEATPKEEPARYDVRLGNRWYPHMKLVIERAPDQRGHLFRADTHDRHIQPAPGSRDHAAFRELMEKNQLLSSRIEAAWEAAGLPTFKSFLRQDLARRRDANQQPS
jgi:hypothetical protein